MQKNISKLFSVFAILALAIAAVQVGTVQADSTAQTLPFSQNWTNAGLITATDDWSGVPGINGYLGQNITTSTGVDPQTLLTESALTGDLTVLANQTATTISNGDVAEFESTYSTIALQGSGTADAPYILINIDTTGYSSIVVSYNLRDIDGTTDNAISPVALQYRVGTSGNFTNVPAGFVSDATTGPSLATLVTAVSATLPAAADNQSTVQVRIITSNAVGNDEWIGVDDISITGTAAPVTPNLSIDDVSFVEGDAGTITFTFTVSLSSPAGVGGVTFDIATQDNSATDADNDYEINSLTGQTIAEGLDTYTFDVTVNGDTNIEGDESFFVNVTNVTGANVSDAQGEGSIINDDFSGTPNLSIDDVTQNEGHAGTTTYTFTVSLDIPAGVGGVTFDIATQDNSATDANNDYEINSLAGQTIAEGFDTYTFNVTVNGDTALESDEDFFVNVTNVTGATVTDGQGLGTITNDDVAIAKIHDIQGSGDTAAPGTFTVEAIVIGDFQAQTSGQLKGFFVQEEDADVDANPATSEGIFIYCNTCPTSVAVGDKVLVTGSTSEYFNMSQLTASTAGSVTVLSTGNSLPTAATITLPIPGVPTGDLAAATAFVNAYYEPMEGMLVTIPTTLYVSEYFELARYGQVILTAGGRPRTFTDANLPSPTGYIDNEINLLKSIVILDDGDNRQNRPVDAPNTTYFHPYPGLSITNYFRGGDTIVNLTGVLHWSFAGQSGTDAWRIRPVTEAFTYTFTSTNPRPSMPSVPGSLKVASFNVLNYFLTIDTTSSSSSGPCGPAGTADCRGADSAQELSRQRTKLLAALTAIDADVFGFMEMENTPNVEPLADIVAGLPGYAYIDTGVIGTDAIRVGIIYKTSTVTPVGSFAVLDTPAFVDPNNTGTDRSRPALAQTFEEIATGGRFTVVVNHLKSKGCSTSPALDTDQLDGQGCWNDTRKKGAAALLAWLTTDPTGSGDPDFLIIGDLNSNAMEDPITTLVNGGYTNLVSLFGGSSAYGYVFDGQLGYLDHALSNSTLTPQVAGVAEWHINADEIPLLDYNDDVKDTGEATFDEESDVTTLYSPDAYRTSDHDPVIIGLNLDGTPPTINVPANITEEATGPSGASVSYIVTVSDNLDANPTLSCSPLSGSTFPLGTTTVNCSASDYAGNTSTASFDITVVDTTDPVITVPTDMTVEATSASGAAVTYNVSATDAVGVFALGCTPASGSTFPLGTTPVNCSASDMAGNTSNASFNINVVDTTAPTLNLPANITVINPAGAVVNFNVTATDLVDASPTIVCVPPSGSTFPVGTTTVNCSATDDYNNTSYGSFTVTVQTGTNLLKKPDFPNAKAFPTPWQLFGVRLPYSSALDCTFFLSPNCSVYFPAGNRSAMQRVLRTGLAGDTYFFGLSSASQNAPIGGNYRVEVTFYNNFNRPMGTTSLSFSPLTHTWETISGNATATGNYNRIVFRFYYQNSSGRAWFDDAFLYFLPTLP